ncbi:hypothetical protein [Dactylosporangium sp. NPDC049140]|uniref:hypothetical protein n=1 Tax=Dactylosporangium sp. NPDC049140 TaxID=3155647 RepID=UPI00340AA49B
MDRGGRRRRLFTALGAALGLLLSVGGALLVAGLLGSSPIPLPGLPGGRQGLIERGGAGEVGVAPLASNGHRSAPPTVATRTTPGPSAATTTERPGNRPTTKPGNAKPSRTK